MKRMIRRDVVLFLFYFGRAKWEVKYFFVSLSLLLHEWRWGLVGWSDAGQMAWELLFFRSFPPPFFGGACLLDHSPVKIQDVNTRMHSIHHLLKSLEGFTVRYLPVSQYVDTVNSIKSVAHPTTTHDDIPRYIHPPTLLRVADRF